MYMHAGIPGVHVSSLPPQAQLTLARLQPARASHFIFMFLTRGSSAQKPTPHADCGDMFTVWFVLPVHSEAIL